MTNEELKNASFLMTHNLYEIPGPKLVPIITVKEKHPLTSSRLGEPLFYIWLPLPSVKNTLKPDRLAHLIEKAEDTNQDYLGWCFSGEIYLPKA
jgi:hypothetical protein